MLFNFYVFLLMFLPITLVGYFLLARRGTAWGAGWLAAAVIFFYAWWDYHYVPLLLLLSVGFNYLIAIKIRASEGALKKGWLLIALGGDLALLAYFKYANFFVSAVGDLSGQAFAPLNIILPAGI